MRPHGTLYEYDVPVADQITFTGTVYFGFSQVRQFPILPKVSKFRPSVCICFRSCASLCMHAYVSEKCCLRHPDDDSYS